MIAVHKSPFFIEALLYGFSPGDEMERSGFWSDIYSKDQAIRVRVILATKSAVGSGQRTYSVVTPSGSMTFS